MSYTGETMQIKKWKLLSSEDVSPSTWFPIEKRVYEMPNGKIIDDFTVTILADVAFIVPITIEGKVVLVNQYKPGVDEVLIQFPAGRIEPNHANMDETAQHELEEETGIRVGQDQLESFGRLTGFSTKATEVVTLYLARNCKFNSEQSLDPTENIEVVTLTPQELDAKIESNEIWCSQTIAAWELAKKRFPEILI